MNCRQFGHTIEKCYLKGGGQEGQGPLNREEKGKVANKSSGTSNARNLSKPIEPFMATISDKSNIDQTNDEDIKLHVANKLISPRSQQTWIVDSGASTHMSLL
jgi:hypothetical protein